MPIDHDNALLRGVLLLAALWSAAPVLTQSDLRTEPVTISATRDAPLQAGRIPLDEPAATDSRFGLKVREGNGFLLLVSV